MNSSYFYNNIPMFPHTQLIPKNYPYSLYNHLYAYQDYPKPTNDAKQENPDVTYKHQITKW